MDLNWHAMQFILRYRLTVCRIAFHLLTNTNMFTCMWLSTLPHVLEIRSIPIIDNKQNVVCWWLCGQSRVYNNMPHERIQFNCTHFSRCVPFHRLVLNRRLVLFWWWETIKCTWWRVRTFFFHLVSVHSFLFVSFSSGFQRFACDFSFLFFFFLMVNNKKCANQETECLDYKMSDEMIINETANGINSQNKKITDWEKNASRVI